MLIRYGTDSNGKRTKVAEIYTVDEHKIDKNLIDREAIKIIRRLRNSGHQAYIVGGAVRDLLMGKVPKDFDIATDALPRKVKSLFRNSRIIGRRFRLVHVFYGDKIIEVSTFRSTEPGKSNNIYGTLEDDVKRRDFSLNALYYSPKEQWVLDYVGGVKDILKKKMRSLIPLDTTFNEDPVRLIRALKYSSNNKCSIPINMKKAIRKYASLIGTCPSSRLTEELFKILQCGNSLKIIKEMEHYGLFPSFMPVLNEELGKNKDIRKKFYKSLIELDSIIDDGEVSRAVMLTRLVEPFIDTSGSESVSQPLFLETYKEIKRVITPMTPPNADVEKAVRTIFRERGLKSPRRSRKRRPKRYSGKPKKTSVQFQG